MGEIISLFLSNSEYCSSGELETGLKPESELAAFLL